MKCAICRKEFTPSPNARRKPKYCSGACKQKAYELRKKIGAKPVNVGGRTPEMVLGDEFEYAGSGIPMNRGMISTGSPHARWMTTRRPCCAGASANCSR